MTTKRLRTTGVLAAALIIPLAAVSAATPASAEAMATVSVLHAIPAGKGADVVDVYAGSAMLIDNFAPGRSRPCRSRPALMISRSSPMVRDREMAPQFSAPPRFRFRRARMRP